MKDELKMESLADSINLYNSVRELSNYCSDLLLKDISNCLEEHLFKPLETAFPEAIIDKIPTELRIDRFSFIVEIPQWKKCNFKLETDHDYGITLKSPENPISGEVRRLLRDIYSDGYKDNEWWPVYRPLNKDINTDRTIDFWKDVENGTVKDFFINWINSAIEKTNKLDM